MDIGYIPSYLKLLAACTIVGEYALQILQGVKFKGSRINSKYTI